MMKIQVRNDGVFMNAAGKCLFNLAVMLICIGLTVSVFCDPRIWDEPFQLVVVVLITGYLFYRAIFTDLFVSSFSMGDEGICLTKLFFFHRKTAWKELRDYGTEEFSKYRTFVPRYRRFVFVCGEKGKKIRSVAYRTDIMEEYEQKINFFCECRIRCAHPSE